MGGLPGLIGLQMEERGLFHLGAQAVAGGGGGVDRFLIGGPLAQRPGFQPMRIAAKARCDGEQQRTGGENAVARHALIPAL